MGVYWIAANDDKREYIHPHDFDLGAKLFEFQRSVFTDALLWLLMPDCRFETRGRWAGDRIRLVPDCTGSYEAICYGEQDDSSDRYANISQAVRREVEAHNAEVEARTVVLP